LAIADSFQSLELKLDHERCFNRGRWRRLCRHVTPMARNREARRKKSSLSLQQR
jgi:hypothetical protein